MEMLKRGICVAIALLVFFSAAALTIASPASAGPVIRWLRATEGEGGATSKLGALHYGSQLSYTNTYYGGSATEAGLNQKVTSLISVDQFNNTGASYNDAVFYAEAVSDTTVNNSRGGLVDGTQNGGWGKLEIRGKAHSSRVGGTPYVRTYSEATADAYVTFTIEDDGCRTAPVLVKFTIEFANNQTDGFNGNLDIFRDRAPVAGTDDRFVNFATFGGLTQYERPPMLDATHQKPFTLEEDLNFDSQRLFDINGNPIVHVFDDPSRPEQFDPAATGAPFPIDEQYKRFAGDPLNPSTTYLNDNLLWGPGSGRGGPIPLGPGGTTILKTNRTWLYQDNGDDYVDEIEMQELLLQDADPNNPANNPLYCDRNMGANADAVQYSRGNTTFNDGLGSHVFYFEISPDSFNDPYSIYAQLSTNLAADGGIDTLYGNQESPNDFATLFYNIEIVPEPGTWIMILSGFFAAGGTAVARKRMRKNS